MPEKKQLNLDAETNNNIFTSGVNQLLPKQKIDIEPHADNNVLNVTNHCLYALTSTDRESTGRGSGAWWFIWMTVFLIELYLLTMLPDLLNGTSQNTVEEHILFFGGGFLFSFFLRYLFLFAGAGCYLFVLTVLRRKYRHGTKVNYIRQIGIPWKPLQKH